MKTSDSDISPVVLITGAARRIGATVAKRLHRSGFKVVIHYSRSVSDAEQLAREFNALRPDSAYTVKTDLLDTDKLPALADTAARRWGRLDVLVNNASSFYPTPVGRITDAHWQDLLGANLKAPLFLSQAAVPHLKATQGCIINIADIHAERPMLGHPVYSIAKAGLVGLTRSLARELAPEIRVNAVAPGAILWPENPQNGTGSEDETPASIIERTALKRPGDPEDIAETIEFLIRQRYITGQIIAVDGGRSLNI
jgi:pteridine reductase